MTDLKQAVAEQFGRAAEAYRLSSVHAAGADLERLVALLAPEPQAVVLDAGCGAGHTAAAIAPFAARVVALDLSPQMLAATSSLARERGLANVSVQLGDVEAIDADDASFDHAASRYSAHHWPNPAQALAEIYRVLRPGGRLVLSDIVGDERPLVDTHLQAIELLRDRSHVRDHSPSQWKWLLTEAGFVVTGEEGFDCPLEFVAWVERIGTPRARVEMLRDLFAAAPGEVRSALQVAVDAAGAVRSFVLRGSIFVAVRGSESSHGAR